MFFVFHKKWIIIFLSVIIFLVCVFSINFSSKTAAIPIKPVVVIDAGHGGIDGGSVGKITGVCESDLNLSYAKVLSEKLKKMNISCVLTREDKNGLYDSSQKNLKRSDMKKRKEIILTYQPKIVVSIHMNSFPLSSSRGAQTFYKKGNEQGRILGENIQKQLSTYAQKTGKETKVGDYYILNCTDIPSVLIECGFLSNEDEEKLLVSSEYQDKLCYLIMSGIVSYLNQN